MASNRQRRLKREKRQLDRRRNARESTARETQAQQAVAAAQHDLAQRHRRHMQAYALYGVAAIIAVGHFFEHGEVFQVFGPGLDDVLVGWPMAAMLALWGTIRYGR